MAYNLIACINTYTDTHMKREAEINLTEVVIFMKGTFPLLAANYKITNLYARTPGNTAICVKESIPDFL